jgi:hypothetical protein
MREFLDVANAFDTPLKVAWIVWLAWGVGQLFWWKYERANALVRKLQPSARPIRRPAPRREKPIEPVGRLITPQHVDAEAAKVPYAAPVQPAPVPVSSAPVFDPAKAIVETFDPRERGDLDAIVADMEANMPRVHDAPQVH